MNQVSNPLRHVRLARVRYVTDDQIDLGALHGHFVYSISRTLRPKAPHPGLSLAILRSSLPADWTME